ncbi:MAG: Oligopeptide-binding protein AppA [Chloroflexi bacterium]|nr:Oligopeptide-binding protein AppA [Chloroflexota bacterium]
MKSRILVVSLAVLIALSLIAVGCPRPVEVVEPPVVEPVQPPPEVAVRGDTLIMGMVSPMVLNPVLFTDVPSGVIIGTVFSGLLKANDKLEFEPDLAKSWEMELLDDGRMVMTFHLRQDVLWHDGAPFTAEDVLFTFETIMDPHTITIRRGDYEKVEKWEVVDRHTFRVTFVEPFAPVMEAFSMGIIPKHLLEGEDVNIAPFNHAPVGTGPFVFREWIADVHVIVDRNENYFGQVPYLDSIVWRVIPDADVRIMELEAGTIDLTGIPTVHYQRMLGVDRIYVHRYPALSFNYFGWNERLPKFDDDRVRKALTLALDREVMADAIYEGLAIPASSSFPPISWASNPAVRPLPYDPEWAARLLKEAGWADTDGDGWLDRDGVKFEFEFLGLAGDPVAMMIIELALEHYKAIGVKLNPLFLEWGDFVSRLDPPRRAFEAFFLGFSVGVDPDPHIYYHSGQAEWGFNDTNFVDARVDELIEAGRREMDFERRRDIMWELHERLNELQPVSFMFHVEALLGICRRFHGTVPSPVGALWNVEYWWVPEDLQRY